jgi:hypothetical protein
MARIIEISHQGKKVACTIEKVDRTDLYGSIDVETRDMDGRPCRLATLAADGRTLLPSGNTAIAYLAADGRWLERTDLIAQDAAGNRLNTVASSFSQPLELETTTTPARFLDHAIRLAYVLDPVEAVPLPDKLVDALAKGAIFKTDFSYRGGVSADPAFVMQGADGAVWLLVGDENAIDYVGLAQSTGLAAGDAEAESEDDLDFDMM